MKVDKFGGASVKNSQAVRNVCHIIREHSTPPTVVVVSAMGKTTNALEAIVAAYRNPAECHRLITELVTFHQQIVNELFPDGHQELSSYIEGKAGLLEALASQVSPEQYDLHYDRIVPTGEILSTKIVSEYLKAQGMAAHWLDARELIKTDSRHREAIIDWPATTQHILQKAKPLLNDHLVVTQGFIGSDSLGNATTLGREGSDFTAAIFANVLNAQAVTVWKDVPGILTADPKRYDNTQLFERLSYLEAVEMTFYGASVIHPKTIKPLANKNIPMLVRSFNHPEKSGTRIDDVPMRQFLPVIIHKPKQSLLSFRVKDFTFINEDNLSIIFHLLAKLNIKINLMQNSAVSVSLCIDTHPGKIKQLIDQLTHEFAIEYQEGLELVTVKNPTPESTQQVAEGKTVVVEQMTQKTYQIVVKA